MPPTGKVRGVPKRRPRGEGSSLMTVTGYIEEAPPDNREGSDEDEDENDDDDNWLDYEQMRDAFSAGTFVSRKKSNEFRVGLRDYNNEKHTCFGRFLLTDPWWDITVNKNEKNQVRGPIRYALRTDTEGIKHHNLVPMLLVKAVGRSIKDPEHKFADKFEEFVRRTGQVDKLTFDHMESLFHQFTRQLDPSEQSSFREVLSSELVQLVLRAHDHPHLLTFLCHLFPSKFVNCLVAPPRRLLHDLQTAAEEEPWVFGFSKILFTRFRLCGVEANLKAFKTAGLLDQMPNTPKDALHIYEVLKADASRDGHTFISFPALRDHRCFTELGYEVNDWQAALKFLSSNGVTHEERFDSKRNIYLYHFWRAECDVTEGLQEILERGLDAEEPTWKVDFNSCDLERLRGDGDQWNAAQKVASSPITILSGKGGCGKTTVVTHIIRHVCSQTLTPVDPAEQDLDNLFNGDLQEIVPGDKEAQQTTCETPISSQNDPTDSDAPQDLLSALAASQSSEITPELVTQLTDYVTSSQQTRGGGGGGDGQSSEQGKETKKRQLRNDLCVDLIKYLATSGETALSSTSVGGKILLTAPTGKAAKLLGHKASMKSYTLHAVIYSYRTFVSAQARKRRQQEASQETEEGGLNRDGRTRAKPQPAQKGAAKGSKGGTQNQAGSSSAAEEDDDVWKFAATEVLVVDECSLAALRLVATLLNILVEHSQLRKVILLGDVRQLPSIDAGNFLSDVFLTFKERGLSVELSTNHRSESELIVSNATRISQRHVPLFDPTRGFHFWNQGDSEESADPERDAAIRYILTSRPELQNQATSQFVAFRRDHCEAINELCCQYYNQHAIRKADGKGNKRPFDFRVGDKICLKKNGQVMNHGLRLKTFLPPEILRALGITPPPPPKKDRKEVGMDAATAAKKVLEGETVNGDATKTTEGSDANNTAYSVCLTDYGVRMEDLSQDSTAEHQLHSSFAQPRTEADTKSGSVGCEGSQRAESQDGSGSQESKGDEERKDKMKQGDVRLCNGEIFFIMHEEEEIVEGKKPQRYLYLSDRDPLCPRVYCCSLAQLKRECHMQHAWARTIHTYQGSESDTVVYYVGEPVHQTWKHVYTAITRGRKSVFIVGKEKNLRDAVWKSDRPRRSRLSQRLKSMLKGLDIQKLQSRVRAANEEAKAAVLKHATSSLNSSTFPATPAKPSTVLDSTLPAARTPLFRVSPAVPNSHVRLDHEESFPDSDDSWVHNMSPSWMVDPSATDAVRPSGSSSVAARDLQAEESVTSHDARATGEDASSPPHAGNGSTGAVLVETSPFKRQLSQNSADNTRTTPTKRSRPSPPIDSIISPVRRSLNKVNITGRDC